MLSAVLVIILTLVFYFQYTKNKKSLYELAKNLSGPRTLPLIGNSLIFAVPQKELLKKFNSVDSQYESLTRYWIGPVLYIAIKKPEHIEAILINASTVKGDIYSIIADCIGYGLIQSSGMKHKIHRKIMTIPLKPQSLDSFMHVFNAKGQECAEHIRKYANCGLFDVVEEVERSSMALVCETILGVNMKSDTGENEDLVKLISGMYKSISERMYKIWLHPYITYRFSAHYKFQKHGMKKFTDFLTENIDKKKSEIKNTKEENQPRTSLEYLLKAKNENLLTDREIMEELYTLFTASEDTTMTTTSFVLLMLAMHKEIQHKVWEEQLEILGEDLNNSIEIQHLNRMKYLHMVIEEALRLFPAAPLMIRKLNNDFTIEGKVLPKGLNIIVNTFHAHRDINTWREPEKFDPMRFTPEEKAKRHPYSYIPFSAGNRSCIGKPFAYMAVKCMVSHIVRRYFLHSDWRMEDIILEADISCRSTNGYKIKISNRL